MLNESGKVKMMSVVERNAVVEAKTSRIESTTYPMNTYEFCEERSTDGFLVSETKHFAPKSVELEEIPDAISRNAVKLENGKSLGIIMGAGLTMERSIVYHGQGPATTRTVGNETWIDAPSRITADVYVPLKDINGLEGALQLKEIPSEEFEKRVEVAPFRQGR